MRIAAINTTAMLNTPILFLIFNRPHTTQRVFDRIREIQPKRLYVAADGARTHKAGEKERCEQTRAIIKQVDWPCEVKTLFRQENLGCQQAIYQGISWFFEQEEMGIILEDDCLTDLSFFPFCEELLLRYKDDERIGHIGALAQVPDLVAPDLSYDFCSIANIWGWASWRRVWKDVDLDFPFWKQEKARRSFLFCNKMEEAYFSSYLPDALNKRNGMNTWDTQYYCSLRLQHRLSIYPAVNLVENIGLGDPNATHTAQGVNNKFSHIYSHSLEFPLRHPRYILCNKTIDQKVVRHTFFSYKRWLRYLLKWF